NWIMMARGGFRMALVPVARIKPGFVRKMFELAQICVLRWT
ncbi:31750_t:CDS:1, partial [Racocetra persica]